MLYDILEGTARYPGLLLAPAEGFGLQPGLFLPIFRTNPVVLSNNFVIFRTYPVKLRTNKVIFRRYTVMARRKRWGNAR